MSNIPFGSDDDSTEQGQSSHVIPPLSRIKRLGWLIVAGIVVLGLIFGLLVLRLRTRSVRFHQAASVSSTQTVTPLASSYLSVDHNRDGIPDTDKAKLGLSTTDFATTHDGISDYDKIHVWHTDPLKTDTDGDGYTDVVEILAGYNPIGPGKLLRPSHK